MKRILYIIYSFLSVMMIGCISEFNADVLTTDGDILVVEGDIIENTLVEFTLSKVLPLSIDPEFDEKEKYVSAILYVVGNDGYKSEPAIYLGNGVHQVDIGRLNDNVGYGIAIEYDGEAYRSILQKPLFTSEISSVLWTQPSHAEDVSIRISTQNNENTENKYYLWEYEEDWEYTAEYFVVHFFDLEADSFYEDLAAPFYYCWQNNKGKEILVGATELTEVNHIVNYPLVKYPASDQRFSVLYRILVKQMAISKESYEYYSLRAKMSEDMGGLFSPQPVEQTGNIVCETNSSKRVVGYVNVAKNFAQKELYISSSDISKTVSENEECRLVSTEQVRGEKGFKLLVDFYKYGYWPLEGLRWGDVESWAHEACVNCLYLGGTKNKPHFWPTNHK